MTTSRRSAKENLNHDSDSGTGANRETVAVQLPGSPTAKLRKARSKFIQPRYAALLSRFTSFTRSVLNTAIPANQFTVTHQYASTQKMTTSPGLSAPARSSNYALTLSTKPRAARVKYDFAIQAAFVAMTTAAILTVFAPPAAHAQTLLPTDPTKHWRILETEHFEIIYDAPQEKLARHFANEAERAERLLQPILKTPMPRKVPIVVADITDSANGSATGIPRSQIEIYPVMPSVTDPTGEYFDWTREVVTHEYVHILNFEPTSGVMSVMRFILGSIWKPPQFLTRWYAEGLAVEMESKLTPVGRGRSHYYSALARSLVEEGHWGEETIDRINPTAIPSWPRGQRPYTYGYFLMHELQNIPHKTSSDGSATDIDATLPDTQIYSVLNHRYGGRFPWFINGPVEDYFGMNYAELLEETYDRVEKRVREHIKVLRAAGAQNGKALAQHGYFNFGARVSPDGLKLAAVVSDVNNYPSIRIWKRKSLKESFTTVPEILPALYTGKDIHGVSWRKNSRHLVFDQADTFKHYSTVNDLYELDTENGKDKRLTTGLRAREAAVMPDDTLIFVTATGTDTRLVQSGPNGEKPTTLLVPEFGERVSSPRPYQDGVIYSHRNAQGREWIEYFSLKTRKATALTAATKIGQMHITPSSDALTPGGFLFAASDSGVLNLYRSTDGGKTARAVTNLTTYGFGGEVDPHTGEIIYSRLTSQGARLEATSAASAALRSSISAGVSNPARIDELQTYQRADEGPAPEAKIVDKYDYHGVSYLFPQYIIPFVYIVPAGSVFSLSTSNADPLRHHQYDLGLSYDTRTPTPSYEFLYANGSLPFMTNVIAARENVYLAGINATYKFTLLHLDTRHFLQSNDNHWSIGPEVTYRQTEYPGYLFTEVGPGMVLRYTDIASIKDYQISPESGHALTLGYDYYLSTWGNTSYQNINGSALQYLSGRLLPDHHVIFLKTSAWVSPPQNTILTGSVQSGGEVPGSLLPSDYVVRGYPVGEFIGSTLATGTFEYRFPISYPYGGPGTWPIFFNKLHGAVFADAVTLKGVWYENTNGTATVGAGTPRSTDLGTYFVSAGGELRSDLQIFYGIPLTIRAGYYYGFENRAFGGSGIFLGFGLAN